MGFAIDGSLRNLVAVARPRPKRYQAELPLEGPGPGEQLLVVPSGRANPKRLWMDLVDRDVDVLVVRIVVTHRDVLVIGKPQHIHKPIHNPLKLVSFEAPIVGVKRDDEVIGALAACPSVLRLDGVDERTRKLEVISSADAWQIGGVKPGSARLGASPLNVAREITEASIRRALSLVPDDHRCPAKRFTARRTSTAEWMSSRFRRW